MRSESYAVVKSIVVPKKKIHMNKNGTGNQKNTRSFRDSTPRPDISKGKRATP